jgi:hypothetical protein
MDMRDPDLEATATGADEQQPLANQTQFAEPEEIVAEEPAADDIDAADEQPLQVDERENAPATVEQVIAQARELQERDAANISREDVSRVRQQYIALRKSEYDAARAAFVEQGGEPDKYVEPHNANDDEFKAILNAIKEKKAVYLAALETERAANLDRKNTIIAEINALAEDTDNVNRTFPRYRELQEQFNAIGEVPAPEETGVWKRFQEARERFSDNLKINKELRDYDFKKNLEQKELLIDEAAKLNEEKDIIVAFKRLQELHTKWREIGPVAKELRDEVWQRFKDASLEINKRYQAHFEERKAREAENEAGKTAICERVEAFDFSSLKSFAAWEQMTEQLKQAQEDWKKFGYASRKMNNALFNRFRATCDTFFVLKAAYFKNVKEELANNLARKNELVAKAEALKDSTEWKKTTEALVALQKEWKTIGTVAKKHSDAVWHRFQQACDYFFEQKKAATSGVRQTEQANLQAKRDLIKELDNITAETPKADAVALINDLQERWKSIGHVPFREKDKVYEAFRTRINEVRSEFDLSDRRGRMERFENAINEAGDDENKLLRERERQMRLLENRRAELRTYENNLGFLSAKSKSGSTLVHDFERKIERLKADITALEDKINLIDSKLS